MHDSEEYIMPDMPTPNIIVVEDAPTDIEYWERLNKNRNDTEIFVNASPNICMFKWMELFAEDFVPRALVCDWHLSTKTMGAIDVINSRGDEYRLKGAAFVLLQCMEAVHGDAGMFIAYTNDVPTAQAEVDLWEPGMSDRLHIIDKCSMTCEGVLNFIIEHDDYSKQYSRSIEITDVGP